MYSTSNVLTRNAITGQTNASVDHETGLAVQLDFLD